MLSFSRTRVIVILGAVALSILVALPNFLPNSVLSVLPEWARKQVSLGLDLQGGSHLLLEVDHRSALRERLEGVLEATRTKLREAQIQYVGLATENESVVFTVREPSRDRLADIPRLVREMDPDLETVTDASNGRVTLRYTQAALAQQRRSAIEQSIEIVRRRVDETGTKEPTIQRQGEDRILVQLPGIDNPEEMKRRIGRTAKLTFRLVDQSVSVADARAGRLPPGTEILPSEEGRRPGGAPQGSAESYVVRKRVMVSGDQLIDAQATFQDNQPVISFKFDAAGARRFGDATRENVGKPFAIVLDNKVISAPVIREPILGGSGVISGSFTVQSANELALLLRAGALPAPLQVLEQRSVGPDLGADSIRAGTISVIVGFVLVLALMIAGYALFGIIANIALLLNLVITMAIMSVLQATLTLPGLAGMVLGLALAVDANVLIYERMREEMKIGRSPAPAIENAFKRAFLTIFDSNLTTFIAALMLYAFGSGPVRGFAVTLAIGIAASMFTAVLFSRLLIVWWLRSTRPKELPL
jgi:preprotein translocase subunit SecD